MKNFRLPKSVDMLEKSDENMPCLALISSSRQQLCIYFNSDVNLNYWHRTILTRQGYYLDPLSQYNMGESIDQGSFGRVSLATHKLSNVTVAIKAINKAYIKKTFGRNFESFDELKVMELLK